MSDKQDVAEVPLSPAWKLGRGQEPPKSALIADGPWSSTANSNAPTASQFAKPANAAGGGFTTRLQPWQPAGGAGNSAFAPSGNAAGTNRWREDERDGKPFAGRHGDRWGANEDSRWAGGEQRTGDRWGGEAGGRGRGRAEERWGSSSKERDPWPSTLPGMPTDISELSRKNSERWDNVAGQPPVGGGGDRWRSPGPHTPGAPAPAAAAGTFDSTMPTAGRGRGFAVGRGRGMRSPYPGTPGADPQRWALNSAYANVDSSTGHNCSYTHAQLQEVHEQLVSTHGPHLPVPDGAHMPDYTGLLAEEEAASSSGYGEHPYRPFTATNADRVESWLAGETGRTASGQLDAGEGAGAGRQGSIMSLGGADLQHGLPQVQGATVSPAAFAADQWIYRDPQGEIQGPFTKVDILDWFEAGFFPQDLPIKSQVDPPEVPFVPLATMLKMWAAIGSGRAPPGFVPPAAVQPQAAPALPQQQQQQQQQQQPEAPNPGRSLLEALGKQLQDPGTPPAPQGQGAQQVPPQQLQAPQGQGQQAQGPGLLQAPLDPVLVGHPLVSQGSGQPVLGMGPGLWGAGAPSGVLGGAGPAGPGVGGVAGLLGATSAWQRGPGEAMGGDALLQSGYRPLGNSLLAPQQQPQQPHPQQQQQQSTPFLGGGMWGFQPAPAPDGSQQDNWAPPQQPQQPPAPQAPAPQPAVQQPQPQPVQAAPVAPWAQQAAVQPAHKSMAEIQREQAAEAARQAGQAPPAAEPPAAEKPGMQGLHPNLQQLFAAVQRAQGQGLAAQQAQPAPAAPAPAAQEVKGKQEAGREAGEQAVAPAEPAPPAKVAPWAAVATAKAPAGKTLREIQEEEAARAAEEAARAALAQEAAYTASPAAAAASAAPSPWARIAAANAGPLPAPGPWGNTGGAAAPGAATAARPVPLSAIMDKEMEEKARAAAAASSPPVGTGPGPRGATIAELMDKVIHPGSGAGTGPAKPSAWGGAAARPPAPSLRDVMFEESAADLEGGAMDEDLSDLLPPQPVRPPTLSSWVPPAPPAKSLREIQEEEEAEQRARAARQAAAQPPPPPAGRAAHDDDDLFWEYDHPSGATPPPPPPPPPQAAKPAVTLASIAAKNAVAPRVAPAPAAKSAWAAAAGPARAVAAAPTVPTAAPAARVNGAAAARQAAAPARQPEPASAAPLHSSAAPLVFGDLTLSGDFKDWCTKEMVRFFGSPDLSLIEFLMTLTSRSEVAEYCAMYMSGKTGVSTFVAEFLKRKDAEVAKAQNPSKKKAKAAAAPVPVTAASVLRQPAKPVAPVGAVPGEEWQEIPGASGLSGSKAGGKAGSKGKAGGGGKKGGFAVLGGL